MFETVTGRRGMIAFGKNPVFIPKSKQSKPKVSTSKNWQRPLPWFPTALSKWPQIAEKEQTAGLQHFFARQKLKTQHVLWKKPSVQWICAHADCQTPIVIEVKGKRGCPTHVQHRGIIVLKLIDIMKSTVFATGHSTPAGPEAVFAKNTITIFIVFGYNFTYWWRH